MCCNQMDHDWTVCNANYHQMVQIMIQLVKNLSHLRIDAPEWCPRRNEALDTIGENVENMNNGINDEIEDENTDERDYRMWEKPKKTFRTMAMNNEKKDLSKNNRHDVLSMEDHDECNDEDTSEYDDDAKCKNRQSDKGFFGYTREILFHKLREKENLLDEKDEMMCNTTKEA